jgi:hypothetical protein
MRLNRKRTFILILVLLLTDLITPHPLLAGGKKGPGELQEEEHPKRFLMGLTIGGGLATSRFDYKSTASPSILGFRFAPTAGLGFDWRLAKHFSLQMNFMYKEKGNRIDMNQWVDDIYASSPEPTIGSAEAEGYWETKLSYVEVSFLPVFIIGKTLEIGAGVFAGYGFTGKTVTDYTVKYDIPDFPLPDETFRSEKPVEFFLFIPEGNEEDQFYVNAIDYGYVGHLGFRMNPFKLSLSVSYSARSWEPDSEYSALFSDTVDKTYNLNGMITFSWFFNAKK